MRSPISSRTKSQYQAHGHPDRKSTRLNSSHDQISYAVFCLKKKNSQIEAHPLVTDHSRPKLEPVYSRRVALSEKADISQRGDMRAVDVQISGQRRSSRDQLS